MDAKSNRWTPLTLVANLGYVECLPSLIEFEADPQAFDGKGIIALHWAAYLVRVDAVRYLLTLGLQLDLPNSIG